MRACDRRCAEASKTHLPSFMLIISVDGSLLVCTCLVTGWQKLWAFTLFLDNDDTIPDFRDFFVMKNKL
jgi:hypothetical protein